ncbi:sugar phosphate nucleotidyltransferase [Akkermansiaceae bacterium]|nr:sugar phosphate nucleotidyltransferase [Akkermansiaceae bacterium]MDB4393526.1 sugar phosphate nucleotidyltransferase [bacterium]MDA7929876.1 sugar phosphate nucleotidyltransferase [Akkermansiaceae bacterium]MDA7933453.1 sugar phosphate nucleotidyltransferase [Akkermansiaceae bacterium]MDB4384011.1 sugar phosphate nucleotidyltransferase [Akkermansiaceae bacterium]
MKIKKAVITAAGPKQQHLPLQTLVSPTGATKTVAAFLLDEIFASGIESVAIVIAPGTETDFSSAVADHLDKITFIEQATPLGYGHAVLCASDFTGSDPFLLMMGDHLYLSFAKESCVRQLLDIASKASGPVSAVQPTHESKLPFYGTVAASPVGGVQGLYKVSHIIEKPTPTIAEQELIVPGLRSGNYLCFFGMHVLTAPVVEHLDQSFTGEGDLPLTPSLAAAARGEKYLACEIKGLRFNIEEPYGLLRAQLGMALSGEGRDEVMGAMIELIAVTRR